MLAVRWHFPLIPARHSQLREVTLLLLLPFLVLLPLMLLFAGLRLGLRWPGVAFVVGVGHIFARFLRGSRHEAIEMSVLKGNQLLLTLLSLLRLITTKRGGAPLLHL